MKDSIIIGLFQNTAILLAFSLVYDFWWNKNDEPRLLLNKILTGFIIGVIGIILMLTPWILIPGLVFDTRSVVLSVSGLFFGGIPTVIAMVITGIFRLSLGGDGVWMGIAVIILSGTIGIIWNKLRPLWKSDHYVLDLFIMGLVIHLVMLGCTIFLPAEQRLSTLKTIIIPILSIYPVATVLLGTLMFRQYKNWQNRNAAQKLNESERRFSEMLKNTMLFSIIIDAQARITFCNKSLLNASDYDPEKITGKKFFDVFIDEESRDKIEIDFRQLMKGEEVLLNYEYNIMLRNGSKLLVSWNSTILRDENGIVTGMASIGENITKRKLTETELVQARIKAEESDRLKSIFLANMSHEIRTPMNAIMGFSTFLGEKGIDESERTQYIDIIRSSSDRLLQLINDILDLSKLEAKQLTIINSECSLPEILARRLESFRKSELLLKKPEIDLILNIPEALENTKFLSDGNRVQQVLDNLISNAIKYTEKGIIETGCSIKKDNGMMVIEFYVKDTGIGISGGMRSLVFERFRQVEEGRFHEGAGLGLSISKGIVDLLGGKIWFESEYNAGSVFYFTIPYIVPEMSSDISTDTTELLTDIRGKHIIIADDDYNSFRYLQLLLKGHNGNITHAENGKVLLDMVQRSVPDLILLDINMPVLSGYEFLKDIKAAGLNIRIIAQTAYAMPDEKERCLSAGCHGYISKPISKTDLFKVINAVLSEK
jgi:PAS domain S-box-containing protein